MLYDAREPLALVHSFTVARCSASERAQKRASKRPIGGTFAELLPHDLQCSSGFAEPLAHFSRHENRARLVLEETLHEIDIAAHVVERDHRDAVPDQSVVCIVPLRPLRVHPNAAAENEVAELAEQRHEQLLQQVDLVNRAIAVDDQLAIRANRLDALLDSVGRLLIVEHCALCVLEKAFKRIDAIRNVRIGEHRSMQKPGKALGMKPMGEL